MSIITNALCRMFGIKGEKAAVEYDEWFAEVTRPQHHEPRKTKRKPKRKKTAAKQTTKPQTVTPPKQESAPTKPKSKKAKRNRRRNKSRSNTTPRKQHVSHTIISCHTLDPQVRVVL